MKKSGFDELIELAVAAPTGAERRNIAARARKVVSMEKPKRGRGQPTKFNPVVASQILSRIAAGETLPTIVATLGIPIQNIYNWIDKNPDFLESYRLAREQQAKTLVDKMLDETANLKSEDALAARVRSDVIKWVASKYCAGQFADSKRLELRGEVTHKHTHELAPEQKRRIAESWLVSQTQQEPDDLPWVERPSIESGVSMVGDEPKELPKRKKAAATKPKALDGDGW